MLRRSADGRVRLTRRATTHVVLGLCVAVVLPSIVQTSSASAQTTAVSSSRDEEARGLFLAGRAAFDDARFAEALEHFERSYALSGRVELLYNVGLAAERTGDVAKAMRAFDRFLLELPDSAQGEDARARLAVLERATALRGPREPSVSEVAAPVAAPAPREDSGGSLVPWFVGGSGLVLAVTGGAFLGVGLSDASSVTGSAQGSSFSDVESQYVRAATFQNLGLVLLGVGLAATATGVTLFLLDDGVSENTTRVTLGLGGLRIEGTF
jgi:tetratricopeptide (TPR) repeat protein